MEALACAKPVLISNQVNIWREIESAGGGIVAEDSLKGTQELLRRWLALSADDRLAMGLAARTAFEKNFSIEYASQRMLNVINNDSPC